MTDKKLRAKSFKHIPNAVRFNEPIAPSHPYFTDFSNLRGKFKESIIFRELHFDRKTKKFDYKLYSNHKVFIFLAGMPGSGKTTELLKYRKILNTPEGFFVVWCSIDQELDINDLEYMDIVIFQMEKLLERLKDEKIEIKNNILKQLNDWFSKRIQEINSKISANAGFQIEAKVQAKTPLLNLFSFVTRIRSAVVGTKENADIIRKTFRYRFQDFAEQFNQFIESVNQTLRKEKKGNEVLFIIDGLEKTLTADIRERIILNETNRIREIEAYTIFTLPVEILRERNRLMHYFIVKTFPFIKLEYDNGKKMKRAYDKFREFIYRRIEPKLFENEEVVDEIIKYSGGSPREILRIIHQAYIESNETATKITAKALEKALDSLAENLALTMTQRYIEKLREVEEKNKKKERILFDETIQEMLEKLILMEYDDGTLKKTSPLITRSKTFKDYVQ